ncbi:MAG: DUF2971 domain-containing protein [Methylotenera sp.]|nr:DUF2971 domain-containing protein [Methylotenera sp.]MDP1958960.1 DUF2971 domain-containing protein [Methylotenera sp.]MDP2404234.1 DUF2971 domain-containing protein [Methylotenera sp.]
MKKLPTRLAFKYRSGDQATLERDLKSLRDATFYAASRGTLNDPFEGRFDRDPIDSQFLLLKQLLSGIMPAATASLDGVAQAANEVLSFVDKSGIFSLSLNPLNELIWSHYGGSHQGFCVGYDLQKLVEFEPNLHYCIDVQYSDSAPILQHNQLIGATTPTATLQRILGVKSTPWRYEQEVRVVTTPPGLHEHDYRAVKKIYFGLRCHESTRLAVMEALAGRGVTYEQVESPDASYILRSIPIEDAYATAPQYKENLAPIMESAIYPDYLKPEQKKHQDYLYKAAEIVRREPYCMEIQLVEFSGSKSTPEQPIIFVQYLRAPNKWVNHYLSLPEIDNEYEKLKFSESQM